MEVGVGRAAGLSFHDNTTASGVVKHAATGRSRHVDVRGQRSKWVEIVEDKQGDYGLKPCVRTDDEDDTL